MRGNSRCITVSKIGWVRTQLLFDRDNELVGVDGPRCMRWRPRDEPNGNPGQNGREKRGDRNRFLSGHRIRALEKPVVQPEGPAVFPIDETEDQRHGTNSVVDYPTRIAALCFTSISSGDEIDVVRLKSGFVAGGSTLPTAAAFRGLRSAVDPAVAEPQVPCRSCASAKNRSFHEAGRRFMRPTLCMNSACFIRLAGVVV